MENKELINKLLNAKIPFTEVQSVTYDCSDNYKEFYFGDKSYNFYRVDLKSVYEEGSLVYTTVWLPESFNGCLAAFGNGGMAGGFYYWDLVNFTSKGFVSVHTDMGTSGGRERGINNPAVWRDFGWRSTHGMAVLGKALCEIGFGKAPDYSYFLGGSTGGQQAFSLAQRFPTDFNGIVAGVPANNRIALHTYFLWNHNHLRKPDGSVMFSAFEIEKINRLAVEFFQNKSDGEKGDDFVSYPRRDDETIAELIEIISNNGFNIEQCEALRAVYQGPVDPKTGKQIYNGMPIGSEIYGCGLKDCQDPESPHYYPFIWCFGDNYNPYDFDFSDDYKRLRETLSDDMDSNNPDLTAFYEQGGKILVYSGSADPCVPYPDAEGYCNRMFDLMGIDKAQEFFRFYLLPGKDHGNGGRGANREWGNETGEKSLFMLIKDWCEQGVAPNEIYAARVVDNKTEFVRKVYPYGSEQNPIKPHTKVCEIF
ncbi:MAG: tannase/feruloyl esterase family alpha/beta hydrolase [Clostridia bacterium]|nr:tannase/feruloyl esterase family alpha/beta hydrolase [Clostridia bacterium]